MKGDRFLTGILIGIAAIVVAALVLFFLRQDQTGYVTEDTPEGVVRDYTLAIYNGDYQRAYSYLSTNVVNKPTLEQFQQIMVSSKVGWQDASLEILESQQTGSNATVTVNIVRGGGLFNNPYREPNVATLVLENGAWKITNMPYPFWSWDWTNSAIPAKPVPQVPTTTLEPTRTVTP